jgi:hypothetical protein
MKNKILVITGMHRSGTSMITQWLSRCGLSVGDRLMGAHVGNEEGHFEDLDFVDFHTAVFERNRIAGSGLVETAVYTLKEPDRQKLEDMIRSKNSLHEEWGWKDPRTFMFLPIYRQVLPVAYYLIIIRDFASVVNSLISRMYRSAEKKYTDRSLFSGIIWKLFRRHARRRRYYKDHTEQYIRVWIAYNEEILEHVQSIPREQYLAVDYRALISSDVPVFSHLHDTWKFTLRYIAFKDIFKKNLLNPPVNLLPYIRDKKLLARAQELEATMYGLIKPEGVSP